MDNGFVKWLRAHPKAAVVMAAGFAAVMIVSVVSSTAAVIWSGVGVGVLAGMVIAYESGQENRRDGRSK